MRPILLGLALLLPSLALASMPERHAVWVQPLVPAVFATVPTAFGDGSPRLYVPVGASLGLSESWTLELEGSFLQGRQGCNPDASCQPFTQLFVAAGPSFSLTGIERFSGFFVEPKLAVAHWWTETVTGGFTGTAVLNGVQTTEVMVGADVGYRRTLGPIFFAVAPGAAVGWAIGERHSPVAGPQRGGGPGGSGPVLALNFNLLRIGGAF